METFLKILYIAAGGAFGSVARYLINISPLATLFEKFPFPTFAINISGSFLIGFFLIILGNKIQVSEHMRAAIMIGFLGAFTTFSTFELEIYGLLKENAMAMAFFYMFVSVSIGFIGLLAGVWLARRF